jgi:hypothetical protein
MNSASDADGSPPAQRGLRPGEVSRPFLGLLAPVIAYVIILLMGCATISHHRFAEPSHDWQIRSGQLLYRTPKTTLIGDVIVRFSRDRNFELTFSKGPGMTLLTLRQDASFAEIKGPLVRGGWSGPLDQAPPRMRGWLELRDGLIRAKDQSSVHHVAGTEKFLFRF